MILQPLVSEKAVFLADQHDTYTFLVPKSADKISVAKAVGKRFSVGVTQVRMVVTRGKPKRLLIQRGRKALPTRRSDTKKAYVRVRSGERIDLFEGSE